MKASISTANLALCVALIFIRMCTGKQSLFQKANFGYKLAELQEFVMTKHMKVYLVECSSLCLGTPYCGSLVFVRSSKTCTLLTATGKNSIPVSAIAAQSDDEQVWIPCE